MSRLDSLLVRADVGIANGQPTMSGKDRDELVAELRACRCEQGVCVLDCPTCPKAMLDYRPLIYRLALQNARPAANREGE